VDFRAVDGEPVRTVMVLLSANAKHHLEALSRIAHLCGRADFVALLEGRAPLAEVTALIEAAEAEWAAARLAHD
jgi:mannitol/fructose-specific phosphotransferase system IIA component (Ntr-type)